MEKKHRIIKKTRRNETRESTNNKPINQLRMKEKEKGKQTE